jgi:uncharacterized protein YggE
MPTRVTGRGVTRVQSRLAALLLAATLAALALACQPATTLVSSPDPGGISVNGTGTVTVVPDVAQLSIGVVARGATVAVARSDAARGLDAVRASLRGNGIDDRDVKTQSLAIRPEYGSRPIAPQLPVPSDARPPAVSGEPVIVAYVVSNIVVVKVRKLEIASKVLDDAVAAGGDATRVNGIEFTVDQPERFEAEARDLAMKDARARAESLARNAGVDLGKPISISESFSGPVPYRGGPVAAQSAQDDVATPLSPGESEIVLNVTVTYAID